MGERTLRRRRPFVLGLARLWLRRLLGLCLVGRGGRMLRRRGSHWRESVSRACEKPGALKLRWNAQEVKES